MPVAARLVRPVNEATGFRSPMLKTWIRDSVPGLFYRVKAIRRARDFSRNHGGAEFRAAKALRAKHGQGVVAGPFAGMNYVNVAFESAYVAKLVGTYEAELHPVLTEHQATPYDRMIDIGSAEGYYAVGYLISGMAARVWAFDIDPEARWYCSRLARLNGVRERLVIAGPCSTEQLQSLCVGRSLVFCDCEGAEIDLLDPEQSPALRQADVLVELHEFLQPGLTNRLLDRFRTTHDIRLIDALDRDLTAYPQLEPVAVEDRPFAVREGRPPAMQWAWMRARNSSPSHPVKPHP